MPVPITVLMVEDFESDADLMLHHLEKTGYTVTSERVETSEAMEAALKRQYWDIVISDYSLPSFSAPEALEILNHSGLDIPFIVVSGTITEETAIGLMRSGAADYLMKDRLARLGPLVKRELNIARVRRETQAALQESQEWSNLIYNSTSDAMYLLAVEPGNLFRCLTVNAAYLNITGVCQDQVVGKWADEVLAKQNSYPYTISKYLEAVRVGHPIQYEESADFERGTVYVETTLTPIFDPNGRCTHLLGSSHEITDRKRVENLYRESEEKFRQIVERSNEVFYRQNINTERFEYVSPKATDMLGYLPEEWMGWGLNEQKAKIHPEDQRNLINFKEDLIQADIRGEKHIEREYRFISKRGEYRWIHGNYTLIRDEDNSPTLIVGSLRDITERKRVEESQRLSEEKFTTTFRHSPDPMMIIRLSDGLCIEVNDGFLTQTGYSVEEVIGKKSQEINIWVNQQDLARMIQGLREKGEITNLEAPFRLKNGQIMICLMSARIIKINGEQCILSITRDITERKLKEREYNTFIQTSFDGFWCSDAQGHFLDVNEALCQLLGYTRDELLGMCIADIEASETPEDVSVHIQKIMQAGNARFQSRHRRKDGTTIDVEISAQYNGAPSERFYDFIHDISERKRAEEALRKSEERLRLAQEAANSGTWEWNLLTNENTWSEKLWQLYGLEPFCCQASFETWLQCIHPEDRSGAEHLVKEVASQGKELNLEWRVAQPEGKDRWLMSRGKPFRDADLRVTRYVGVVIDITERKQAEKQIHAAQVEAKHLLVESERSRRALLSVVEDQKEAEEQIRRLNAGLEQRVIDRTAQLAAANHELEAFAYSVSHDLQGPLRALDGFSTILLLDYADKLDEQGRHSLHRIQEASKRMGQLINDLLNLSRITRAEINYQRVDLSALAGNITDELLSQSPQRQVEIEIAADMIVHGDMNLIKIAMENLLNNAFKFTSKCDRTKIQVGVHEQNSERVYYVSDNGTGFYVDGANKLFTPFQRFHSGTEFPGTGIGLSIVHRIITRHKGRIWPDSEIGKGTTFYFTLPADG